MRKGRMAYVFADFYGVTAPAREKDSVAGFDRGWHDVALGIGCARANCDDGGLWERR